MNAVTTPTSILTSAERHKILVEWNATATDYPRQHCLHELFAQQAARTPEAVAVICEGDSATYRELDQRANQLAQHLQKLGVGPERLVAISLHRSLEMVVGLLGILKAGGAYVPVDPDYPADRVAHMLKDANAPVVLASEATRGRLAVGNARVLCLDRDRARIAQEQTSAPVTGVQPENLAYVIYTSGSTGQPKGVMNTHAGIVNRLLWMQDRFSLNTADRVLQKTPFSFDISIWEFFWPLLNGARLVLAAPGGHRDPAYLQGLIRREAITALHFVPSMLRHFLRAEGAGDGPSLRLVFCGGEAITPDLQEQFFQRLPTLPLHNLYGPTEAAVDVTHWACQPDSGAHTVPIGRPIANIQIYILDEARQPVPVGMAGELHIGGIGLARGYLNRPELTAEKFIPHPFSDQPGARLYRTGDLARYLADGNIEFLGRMDHQVKVRGFRIELGEIEAVLGRHPAVTACAVIARADEQGDTRLEAYLTLRDPGLAAGELQAWLGKTLPEHMVPAIFVELKQLPLTPNGKLDRKALPLLEGRRLRTGTGYAAPGNDREREWCKIWQEVLGVERIGTRDNFFELGGHSLQVMQVLARVERAGGGRLALPVFFEHPTVAELAGQRAGPPAPEPPAEPEFPPAPPDGRCIHELFAAQAGRTPQAVAVELAGQSLTYQELDQRASELARHLTGWGIGPEVLTGVCLERSLELAVAMLAVFKAGGALVPLDPGLPGGRLAFMMADAQIPVLLTHSALREQLPPTTARLVCLDQLPAAEAVPVSAPKVSPENLAFVIYTSGSTGQPKGVQLTQSAYLQHRGAAGEFLGLQAADRVLQFAEVSFDTALDQLLTPLLAGATVVIRGREICDPLDFADYVRALRLTMIHLTPVYWQQWVEALAGSRPGDSLGALRLVQVGGDVMPVPAVRSWCGLGLKSVRLINRYGPTETTLFCLAHEVPGDLKAASQIDRIPLGRPVGPRTIYILDAEQNRVPAGTIGEIYIGGETLARGYHNRPELTAERFLPNPFSARPGARFYRTGDLARVLPDGTIDFLGRADYQVKLRGYRVELGEVDAVMGRHPAVRTAVTLLKSGPAGDRYLAVYLVPRAAAVRAEGELRAHAKAHLPEYMIPARFVWLDELPLTPNGKADRRALEKLETRQPAGAGVPPRTPLETQLAAIWQETLGMVEVGMRDNFFDLGGHSLLATRVVLRIREVVHRELSVRSLFEAPTIEELAKRVALAEPVQPPAASLAPDSDDAPPPLTSVQEGLWFLAECEPESTAYHMPLAWRLKGALRTEVLAKAFAELLRRHDALRTTFRRHQGQIVQVIAPPGPFSLPVVDLTGQPEPEVLARRLVGESLQAPFDLAAGPLLRAQLFRVAPEEHLLLVNQHHMVSDDWSVAVLCRELSRIQAAMSADAPVSLPALPWQYADYARWQRQWLQGVECAAQAGYWQRQLARATQLELPTDFARPPRVTYAGARQSFSMAGELAGKLAGFNRQAQVTPFMSLLAAWQVLLSRYSGQEDILVGTPAANRQRMEAEGLIGFFVNTLVMRGDLSGRPSFRELVRRVRTMALGAYQHQELPFEEVVKLLNPARDASRNPVFQVLFALQNAPNHPLELTGLDTQVEPVAPPTTHFDLELHLWQTGQTGANWAGMLVYNTDLFTAETIQRLTGHYLGLLESLLTHPDQSVGRAEMLTEAERQQLLAAGAAPERTSAKEQCVHPLFAAQAARTPDAVAVAWREEKLTYRELNQRADQLGRRLQTLGVGPDVPVVICLERSLEMVTGLLGILKAGGAYVPVDPKYPAERVAFMVRDSRAPVVLTRQAMQNQPVFGEAKVIYLDADGGPQDTVSVGAPAAGVKPENLAYMIYTSGSTGQPKGVGMPHGPLVNLLAWQQEQSRCQPGKRTLNSTSPSFDVSFQEIFSTLCYGGTLVILPPESTGDPAGLLELIETAGVDRIFVPFVVLRGLAELVAVRGRVPESLREVITAGEQLQITPALRTLFAGGDMRLVNQYGPTETHVITAYELAGPAATWPVLPPIGRPIANVRLQVLDEQRQPVADGLPGELYAGGAALARGYWQQESLTRERFIADPFGARPGDRLYRTGDLVRRLPSGEMLFLGRRDRQVKIRGHRVEPGEIEAVLGECPELAAAAVVVQNDADGGKKLAAFVVPHPGAQLTSTVLRQALAQKLPEHMIPPGFYTLDALPVTPNGKVDRTALEQMTGEPLVSSVQFAAPRTALERQLAEIWQATLQVPRVGRHDTFFELGGHSILAMRAVLQMGEALGINLPVRLLFEAPTVAQLAGKLDLLRWSSEAKEQAAGADLEVIEI